VRGPSQSYDVVGARVPPWPQYERRSIDGAPPLLDSPHAPTGSVPSSNSANRRMTELARPTSTRSTMTQANRAPPRAGRERPFPLDKGRRFTEGGIKAQLTEPPFSAPPPPPPRRRSSPPAQTLAEATGAVTVPYTAARALRAPLAPQPVSLRDGHRANALILRLCPGLGQFYNRQQVKGGRFFGAAAVLSCFTGRGVPVDPLALTQPRVELVLPLLTLLGLWLWSIIDAWRSARWRERPR
jgi:hypothetical protein